MDTIPAWSDIYAIQRHLCLNMNIKWDPFFRNEDVLVCAGVELRLVGNNLHWFGRVCRLDDDGPLTDLLYGELRELDLLADQH